MRLIEKEATFRPMPPGVWGIYFPGFDRAFEYHHWHKFGDQRAANSIAEKFIEALAVAEDAGIVTDARKAIADGSVFLLRTHEAIVFEYASNAEFKRQFQESY